MAGGFYLKRVPKVGRSNDAPGEVRNGSNRSLGGAARIIKGRVSTDIGNMELWARG